MIDGYYHRYGYTVYSDGEEIYSAGNCPGDSQARVSLKRPHVPVEQLREWCKKTVAEFAKERGEKTGIVDFDGDWDEEYAILMKDHGGKCRPCGTDVPLNEPFCPECGLSPSV